MYTVTHPEAMNEIFAQAFNSRRLENLMSLYETRAALRTDATTQTYSGHQAIAGELEKLLVIPGTLVSHNSFCIQVEEIALLRADYTLLSAEGNIILSGSSAEVIRRQPNGLWLYLIDHALGGSLPRNQGH